MNLHRSFFIIASILSTANVATATVHSSDGNYKTVQGVRGRYKYYYNDENSSSSSLSTCETIFFLVVGTAMSVGDYEDLATKSVQDQSSTVFVVVDNNPGAIPKTSDKKFATLTNAIVKDITTLVPPCAEAASNGGPMNGYLIGGHSAGGQAAINALDNNLLNYNVKGFIGLAPYKVVTKDGWFSNKMSINVPSLLWGFSKTSCMVDFREAALGAYQISDPSPDVGRVFYQVQTNNWNSVTGGPHCSFTDNGCAGMCFPAEYSWIHDAVATSIGHFIKAIVHKRVFTKDSFKLFSEHFSSIDLFINKDEVLPQSSSSSLEDELKPAYA